MNGFDEGPGFEIEDRMGENKEFLGKVKS